MSNVPLTTPAEAKDLVSSWFYKHTSYAVQKASKMLGLFRATFTCLDEIRVPKIFMAIVRPHLEYGNLIKQRLKRFKGVANN